MVGSSKADNKESGRAGRAAAAKILHTTLPAQETQGPKGRGLSVRGRWSSQAVSVGLHCAGRAVLACFERGEAWRSMSRRKRVLRAASVYGRKLERGLKLWARGERPRAAAKWLES